MFHGIEKFIFDPYPTRTIAKKLLGKWKLGSYERRLILGAVDRPHYGCCVFNAAMHAKSLGIKRISVLEYGVAGGNGLLNLEMHSGEISKIFDVEIDIYGFDTGE